MQEMNENPSKLIGCLSRIVSLYQFFAVILLTTILLILATELGIGLFRHIRSSTILEEVSPECPYFACNSKRASLPYYQQHEWGEQFWAEEEPRSRFHPYTMWRTETTDTEFMTFNEDGLRETPGTNCSDDSYHIYMYGGSTLWGVGAPDWGTIPAYLQSFFNEETIQEVCIHNMGQRAYHATQEVIDLTNQLQRGVRPNMVIFYDGINEIGNTIALGSPWIPSGFNRLITLFQGPQFEELLQNAIAQTNFYYMFERVGLIRKNSTSAITPYSQSQIDSVVEETLNIYLNNYQIVNGLSKQFQFDYYFFWQPTIGTGDKQLTPDEEEILRLDIPRSGPGFFPDPLDTVRATYSQIEHLADEYDNLYYIGNVLDDYEQQIFIDIWHITPKGNEIVARKIFETIQNKQ